jgi:hypothetical protein
MMAVLNDGLLYQEPGTRSPSESDLKRWTGSECPRRLAHFPLTEYVSDVMPGYRHKLDVDLVGGAVRRSCRAYAILIPSSWMLHQGELGHPLRQNNAGMNGSCMSWAGGPRLRYLL